MCAEGHRPICQDTGIVNVFLQDRHGRALRGLRRRRSTTWSTKACAAATSTRTTCCAPRSWPTRSSTRKNTKDNTPAVIHIEIVPGDTVDVTVAAKGGGSENKSKFAMLNPSRLDRRLGAEDRADDGRRLVPAGHARHRHRRHRREGDAAGQGSADGRHRHARAARRAARRTRLEELRIELYEKVNALGIGAQGLGGLSTVLDVKIHDVPDARREQAGRDDPELRGDAPRALHARRLGPGLPRAAEPRPTGRRCTGRPTTSKRKRVDLEHADAGRGRAAGSRARRCCSTARC